MSRLTSLLSINQGVAALSLVSLLVMMGSSMATPSLTLYAGQFPGANEFLIGAVIAGFAIGRLVFDIPSGFLADRLGTNRTMALGLGILVCSSVFAGLAPSYLALLSARVLEGVGSSIYVSAAISYVLISSDPSRRGTTMGTYQSILMLGPIAGPIAGAPIAALFGYNAPYFAFAGMMAVALAALSYLGYRGKFRAASTSRASSNSTGAVKMSYYINTAGIATFGFAFMRSGIYTTGMPLFAYDALALTIFDVGLILTVASLANLAASYFAGRLTLMFGMRKPLAATILFSAVLVAIIPLASSALQLLVIMMLIGITSGFFGQSIAWAAEQIEAKFRMVGAAAEGAKSQGTPIDIQSHVTRGIGFNRMIGDLGLILGPLFVGYVVSLFSEDSMTWILSFGLTSLIIGTASMLVLKSPPKQIVLR